MCIYKIYTHTFRNCFIINKWSKHIILWQLIDLLLFSTEMNDVFTIFFFFFLQWVRLKEPRGTKFIFFLICFSVSCSLFIHWDLFHCLFSGTENRVVFRGTDFLFLSLVSSLLFLFLSFSPWTNPLSWISTTGLSESVYLLHLVKRER